MEARRSGFAVHGISVVWLGASILPAGWVAGKELDSKYCSACIYPCISKAHGM